MSLGKVRVTWDTTNRQRPDGVGTPYIPVGPVHELMESARLDTTASTI